MDGRAEMSPQRRKRQRNRRQRGVRVPGRAGALVRSIGGYAAGHPRLGRAAGGGSLGLPRANDAPGHNQARGRHRVRPCMRPEFRAHARRQLAFELLRLTRPLPAHPGRLEVHRTRRRDQVPGHHSAGGLTAPRSGGRPLTRVPRTSLRRRSRGSGRDDEAVASWVLGGK
jgi:hypothetical protein